MLANLEQWLGPRRSANSEVLWERSARHEVALVRDKPSDACWFIKHCGAPTIAGGVSLDAEALFHASLDVGKLPAELRDRVARLLECSPDGRTLVFQGLSTHRNLRELVFSENVDLSATCAALGRTVSLLHAGDIDGFPKIACPVVTHESCSPEGLAHGPRGYAEFLRALQAQPELIAGMKELRSSWTPNTLVHGDLKTDNVLIVEREVAPLLVDWELSGIGDWSWDVGTFIGSLMFAWIESLPNESVGAEERQRIVLEAISAFYRHATVGRPEATEPDVVRRVFAWAGYYLVDVVLASLPLSNGRISAVGLTALHLSSNLLVGRGAPLDIKDLRT